MSTDPADQTRRAGAPLGAGEPIAQGPPPDADEGRDRPPADDVPDPSALHVPPVVAVMVTNEPGPWFEEALAALGAQDYPSLSVLVVDAGSSVDPTARVAAVLPRAYVRRLPDNVGFAAAANEVLHVVEGASHYLFCHDDVAPEPDAVRLLVEEAYRSNAGVVAPKLVDWDEPQRILQVGMGADKSGAPDALAEPGELDQEQHDAVKDVFVAPGGATLVRADLFATLGGFDGAMTLFAEDLDLSWRAQVAGARVIVAPAARVRHVQALGRGRRGVGAAAAPVGARALRDLVRPYHLRHRLRVALKCYGRWHAIRVVPQVALLAAVEVVIAVVTGNRAAAKAIFSAWKWNLSRRGELRTLRRSLEEVRSLPDTEVRRLQVRGSARARAVVRGQLIGTDTHEGPAARWLAAPDELLSVTGHAVKRRVGIGVGLALVLLLGSRDLITGSVPDFGQFGSIDGSPFDLLRAYVNGWRSTGLGGEAPAPPGLALFGVAGTLLFGSGGLLRTVLVLGAIPVGVLGARWAGRALGDRPAVAAAAVYLLLPLPYGSIARGRLGGLAAYALAPWVLGTLARVTELPPFGPSGGSAPAADTSRNRLRRVMVGLGVAAALSAAIDPAVPLAVFAVLTVGLVTSVPLAGHLRPSTRAAAAAAGGLAVGTALLFPWTLDALLPGSRITSIVGVDLPAGRGLSMLDAIRFHTGEIGGGPLGFALPLVALLPLVVGNGWRLAWAARLWTIVCLSWIAVWSAGRFGLPMPSPEVVLAGGGAALALAVGLGLAAFEVDLPGHRFGWRQTVSFAAAVGTGLAVLPIATGAFNGAWHAPDRTFSDALSWMPEQRSRGEFRVLWLGDPEALPLGAWRLDEGLAYGTSRNGLPTTVEQWPSASPGAAALLAEAVDLARMGGTTSMGRLLGPSGIRYVVVPSAVAPERGAVSLPPPPGLLQALAAQVDLRRVDGDAGLIVYENSAFGAIRTSVDDATAAILRRPGVTAARLADVSGGKPVLIGGDPTSAAGELPAGPLHLAEAASPRWRLEVAGTTIRPERASWANLFEVPSAGPAKLSYRTSPTRWLALALQLGLWVAALRSVFGGWRRARRGRRATAAQPVQALTTVGV